MMAVTPGRPPMSQPQPPCGEPEHTPGHAAQTNLATSVTAYLIAGPVGFGGIGYLLDHWLGTGFLVVVGLLVGMALSLYVIWLRYGTS